MAYLEWEMFCPFPKNVLRCFLEGYQRLVCSSSTLKLDSDDFPSDRSLSFIMLTHTPPRKERQTTTAPLETSI